jgi:hypothetical protein
MSTFESFNEAARLYAENVPVIDAMRQAMEANIDEFLACLWAEVERRVKPAELEESTTPAWRSWFLTACKKPWVGFQHRLPAIVFPGKFTFYVSAGNDNRSAEYRARGETLAQLLKRRVKDEAVSTKGWALLTVEVAYEKRNPVAAVAPVVAAVFLAIAETWPAPPG